MGASWPKKDADDNLLKATLLSTGIYTDVSLGEAFRYSKKACQNARRAMVETGTWEAGGERANMRARRTQVDDAFHSRWLLDIIAHTSKRKPYRP